MTAAHLLAKLGKDAVQPRKVGSVWRKAAVSAKNIARLRKSEEFDWLNSISEKKEKKERPPKGHKHDRLKVELEKQRAEKMANMSKIVAEYRQKKNDPNVSALDRLVLTKKQLRQKSRGG